MILARATQTNDRPLMIVGLTQRNADHLDAGHPIFRALDELGIEADMLLLYAETPEDLMRDLGRDPADWAEGRSGLSVEAASLDVEYELSLDGAFQGEPASLKDEAFDRALELKALHPESVVAIVVTGRGE